MQAPDLSFLQVRIMSIGTALFFCEDNAILPFPAYMITALKTDESGNIWFLINRSWNKTVSYDTCFPANLEFYRKGYPLSIHIKGQASLVSESDTLQNFMQELVGKSLSVKDEAVADVILVKVKIESASYKELVEKKASFSFRDMIAGIKTWLSPGNTQLQPSM